MLSSVILGAAALAATAFPPPKDLDVEVRGVIAEWTGDYRSESGEPERSAVVRPIVVPKLAQRAVFVEVRDGDDKGRIIFQRIIGFSDQPQRVRNWAASYYFMDPAPHARLDLKPEEAARLSPDHIYVFAPTPDACALQLFREDGAYTLTAHKDMCHIVSRFTPGLIFHPDMRLTIGKGSFSFFEQGFFEDGRPVAPALHYTLRKVGS